MNAPALEADALRKVYRVGGGVFRPSHEVRALDGITFSLERGRTLAVVGESGCGKSTLARQITLLEQPSAGAVRIGGVDALAATGAQRRSLRTQVQMVFQNPYGTLNPRKTALRTLQDPLAINARGSRGERRERALAMLEQVGLRPEHGARYPHMFSGGQRQRIAIARAMMLDPAVLVADEPTSSLDVSVQAQILNLFMDLQLRFATAFVFISHNLAVVEHVADELLVMYFGRAVEQGAARRIFDAPAHPYTRALMAMTPSLDAAQRTPREPLGGEPPSPLHPPAGCAFHPRCPLAVERCRTECPALREFDGRHLACHRAGEG